jgi:hypothetical protein
VVHKKPAADLSVEVPPFCVLPLVHCFIDFQSVYLVCGENSRKGNLRTFRSLEGCAHETENKAR